jgi:hypothetical protein
VEIVRSELTERDAPRRTGFHPQREHLCAGRV